MFGRRPYNESLYNQGAAGFTSPDSGSSRAPYAHTLVAVAGRVLWFYQDGAGLVMRVSADGGASWGAKRVVSSRTDVYPSALADPQNNVHLVYSAHGDPPASDEGVYYRPLLWNGLNDWTTGAEQQLAGGGSLYDPGPAGRRNATIWADPQGRLVISYLRNEAGVVTLAALVGRVPWTCADLDADLDVGVAADDNTRAAALWAAADEVWLLSRTGSTYSLARQPQVPAPLGDLDLDVLDAWLGDAGDHLAVAAGGGRVAVVYLRAGVPYLRLYDVATAERLSETQLDAAASSVTAFWGGDDLWVAWVGGDVVKAARATSPATVAFSFANPGPAEGWSYLNAPAAAPVGTGVLVWQQTSGGSKLYAATFGPTAAAYPAAADSAAGSDEAVAANLLTASDSGAGSDSALGGPVAADSGAGSEAVTKSLAVAESGSGADGATAGFVASDSGSSSDSAQTVQRLSADDAASGADSGQAVLPVTDAGQGEDTVADTRYAVADAASGADSAAAVLGPAEAGAGGDEAVLVLLVADSGGGAEGLVFAPSEGDSGQGSDTAFVGGGGAVGIGEAGSGADAASVLAAVAEAGAAADGAAVTPITTADVVRLLVASGRVRLRVES